MWLTRRLAWGFLVMWLAATLAFFALRVLPSDAISVQMMDSGAPPEAVDALRTELGLTDSLPVQYGRFMTGLVRGDLGVSLLSGQPVSELIALNLGPTITLALSGLAVAVALGLALGLLAGVANPPALAALARLVVDIALSTPIYWTGTLAIYLFTVQLALLPSGGSGRLSQLILPSAVLGFHTAGAIARVVAQEVRQQRQADFVRAARAKGLTERRILFVHVLRASSVPVLTVISLQAGFLLSGVVVAETLFVRQGLGRLLLDSTLRQDYPVVQGVVVLSAVVYTLLNTLTDLAFGLLDPRTAR